jgi:hypothetical protein
MSPTSPIRIGITLLTCIAFAVSIAGAQTTWYVDDDGPGDPAPGSVQESDPLEDGSPEHPFDAIQEGINAAVDGDLVLVADGRYVGVGNRLVRFHGKAVTVRSMNGPADCVIDCNGQSAALYFQDGESNETVVDGLTITDGEDVLGGAIYVLDASPTFMNCVLLGNAAEGAGGAVFSLGGGAGVREPTRIVNCVIEGNQATESGGGIAVFLADLVIEGSALCNNISWGVGGAIACVAGEVSIDGCDIHDNTAFYKGGGLHCSVGPATIRDCTVTENMAGVSGGGVYTDLAALTLTGSAVTSNIAYGYLNDSGAGVSCLDSQVEISACAFIGNTSYMDGGGLQLYLCEAWVTDTAFNSNAAVDSGAGVDAIGTTAMFAGCVVSENVSSFRGGGISSSGGDPTFVDCEIADNSAVTGGGICSGGKLAVRGCEIRENVANYGGGIYWDCSNARDYLIVVDSAVSENTAARRGGGIHGEGRLGPATIANSTIAGNMANGISPDYGAAGLFFLWTDLAMVNCEVVDNVASRGDCGGLRLHGPRTALLSNCTIAHNTAQGLGGGVGCDGDRELTLVNSVVWGNSADAGSQLAARESRILVSYSDVDGGEGGVYLDETATLHWGPGNIDTDPLFVDPDVGDYHVSAGSPCIDAGCNCGVPRDVTDADGDGDTDEYLPFDLDGEGRFFDDPDTPDTGSGLPPIVDMGAYEFGGSDLPPCRGDLDGDRDVDAADLSVLLANYGMLEGATGADGDMDCDGDVGLSDLARLLSVYGTTCE